MEQKVRYYAGQEIVISWDARRCMHAGECLRGLPTVFDTTRRPWIEPAGALPDAIAEVIHRCPSGALHYHRLDGGPAEVPDDPATMVPARNGPLYVRGLVQLRGADGTLLTEDTRMTLCRCGASRNKPFCDGSHRKIGFTDDVAPTEATVEANGA